MEPWGTLGGVAGAEGSADGTQEETAGKCGESPGQCVARRGIQQWEESLQGGLGQGLSVLSGRPQALQALARAVQGSPRVSATWAPCGLCPWHAV